MARLVTESPANAIWPNSLRGIQWTDGRVRKSV
jgi:hypothetical protein